MKKLVRQLVENIFRKSQKVPSELFIESLSRYTKTAPKKQIDEEYLKILLKRKSYHAFLIYENLKRNNPILELCYVLVSLSDTSTPIIVELTRNLKKASLGFKVSHYNDTKLVLLRGKIENHIYEIVFQIYQHSCIYRGLKDATGFPSMSMQYFNEIVLEELRAYESKVVEQEEELLSFYVGMYSSFLRLKIVHQIYECFKDNPKKPFEFLRLNFTSSQPFTQRIIQASAKHLNNCVKSLLSSGQFEDDFKEFFIEKRNSSTGVPHWETFTVVQENIPYFISVDTVEDILYTGRCISLLRWISSNYGFTELQCICPECCKKQQFDIKRQFNCYKENLSRIYEISNSLDLLNKGFASEVSTLVEIADSVVEEAFVRHFGLLEYIEGLRNVFLCGRADFLETIFHKLKEIKKLTKRSYGYVLDTALQDTVGYKNEFYSTVDVYLLENSSNFDNFTLFSNVPHPLSIVIGKETVFDLSKIFKFLWTIKRVEHLLRRARGVSSGPEKIKIISYINLLNRFYFFLFEEVISPSLASVVRTNRKRIAELQSNLKVAVRNILKKMYVDYENKLFYRFIKQLEEKLIDRVSKNTPFDDNEIQSILVNTKYHTPNEFIESMIFDISRI
ncbi:Gamma-tubulin complex component 3 [Nosema granulosis]|uniref:Spindle pole body component n=1 Tax=Nosema granulosis TaxID=83296 RepID=A0A9P6KXL6_9MICR|nr:Gamma-tubulin complex component 3 [Nosema granulosis]